MSESPARPWPSSRAGAAPRGMAPRSPAPSRHALRPPEHPVGVDHRVSPASGVMSAIGARPARVPRSASQRLNSSTTASGSTVEIATGASRRSHPIGVSLPCVNTSVQQPGGCPGIAGCVAARVGRWCLALALSRLQLDWAIELHASTSLFCSPQYTRMIVNPVWYRAVYGPIREYDKRRRGAAVAAGGPSPACAARRPLGLFPARYRASAVSPDAPCGMARGARRANCGRPAPGPRGGPLGARAGWRL